MTLKTTLGCPAGHEASSSRNDRPGRCGKCGAPLVTLSFDDAAFTHKLVAGTLEEV